MGNGTISFDPGSQVLQDVSLVLMSAFSFLVARYLLYVCSMLPKCLNTNQPEKFYWFNVLGSLVHSIVSGSWCLMCFSNNPGMASDLIHGHDSSAHALVAMSTGYFIYDVIDNLCMLPFSKSWEIVLHHFVVITCFGISVFRHQYVGYAVVSLLVEVNSVFLHIRQLLRLAHINPERAVYKLNSITNLISFVLFRICTLAYMTYWLLVYADVPRLYFGIGAAGMIVMTVMNTILFIRLLVKDCLGRDPKRRKPKESATNGISNPNGVRSHIKTE